jgi:transcriptional regulator with XRE-family HTH domain
VDTIRFGHALRALRRRASLSQADVARRAGTSASTVSRIERGRIGRVGFATLRSIGAALDAEVQLHVRWRGEALDRLLDAAHAALVEATVRLLRTLGWEVAVEVSFSIGGERGSIDVLGWHPATGFVLVVEVKSVVPDNQATLHGVDRKARLAPIIARERGWTCLGVARLLVVGEGRTARRRVDEHAAMFDAALPARGTEMRRWLREPVSPPPAGILFLEAGRGRSSNRRPSSNVHGVTGRRGLDGVDRHR